MHCLFEGVYFMQSQNYQKNMIMNNDEYFNLARNLEKHDVVFSKMFEIGKPIFSDKISTAAVSFDQDGQCVLFQINPDFWYSLDQESQLFVICHECLHVFLNHGFRGKDLYQQNAQIANQAMDISINHMLINHFGFNRENIHEQDKLCWVDTCFEDSKDKDDNQVEETKSFETYYMLLRNQSDGSSNQSQTLDSHEGMFDIPQDLIDEASKTISDQLSNEEIEDFIEKMKSVDQASNESPGFSSDDCQDNKPGTLTGNMVKHIDIKKNEVKKKPKWETVIKKWTSFKAKNIEQEQWVQTNRRFVFFNSPDVLLPSEIEIEDKDLDKINLFFVIDNSGSCFGYTKRFVKAAYSLDPQKFNVRIFAHDTAMHEVKNGRVRGGGGTDFRCIERYIQNMIVRKKIKKYPEAVFHLTDGYASPFAVEKPQNWCVFLTPYGGKYAFPSGVSIYNLLDYE